MRNLFCFVTFVFLIICCGCNKCDESYCGEADAIKNDNKWKAEINARNHPSPYPGILISFNKLDSQGGVLEGITFQKIPFEEGKYQISNDTIVGVDSIPSAIFSITLDGHVGGGGLYKLLNDNIEDFLEITEIVENDIKGDFQASFVNDTTDFNYMGVLDTIIFSDGNFEATLIE